MYWDSRFSSDWTGRVRSVADVFSACAASRVLGAGRKESQADRIGGGLSNVASLAGHGADSLLDLLYAHRNGIVDGWESGAFLDAMAGTMDWRIVVGGSLAVPHLDNLGFRQPSGERVTGKAWI